MNKTLLYVTAAAGLVASGTALADAGNVEIYGTLNVDFENVRATGATAFGTPLPAGQMVNGSGAVGSGPATLGQPSGNSSPSRNRVTQNSSNIGFRGNEDLGMGLKAIFQIESGVALTSAATTTTTAGTTSTGFFASRNSNVGLSSTKLGTLFYGNWDTPYKALTNTVAFDSFYGTGIPNDNTLIGTPGFGVQTITTSQRNGNSSDASFDRRQGNSVQYWTPQFWGFSARALYSANQGRATEPPQGAQPAGDNAANPNINPTIYGASLAYEYGPFRVAYGFEQHRDYFGLTQLGGQVPTSGTLHTSRDNGNKVTLSYNLPWAAGTTSLNVALENLSYNNSDNGAALVTPGLGNLTHYDRDLIYFAAKHQWGASTFRLGFGDAWKGTCQRNNAAASTACSTAGLDAKHYAFGYSYSFSKRTDVYGFYTLVNNGGFANYELGNNAPIVGNITATAGAGVGARQQGYGLGIRHVF